MDTDSPQLEIARMMHHTLVTVGVASVAFVTFALLFFWLAAKPQRFVAGVRRFGGANRFVGGGAEPGELRSLRRKFVVLATLLCLGVAFLMYSFVKLRSSSRALFGGSPGEYLKVHDTLARSISEIDGAADGLLEKLEQAKALEGSDAGQSASERREAIEAAQESLREMKATIEGAKR